MAKTSFYSQVAEPVELVTAEDLLAQAKDARDTSVGIVASVTAAVTTVNANVAIAVSSAGSATSQASAAQSASTSAQAAAVAAASSAQQAAAAGGAIASVPASATATGIKGQLATDGQFLFVCVSSNSWKRIALTSF